MTTTSKSYADYVVFVESKAKTYFAALCVTISTQSYAASVRIATAAAGKTHDIYVRWIDRFEKGRLQALHNLKQTLEEDDHD